MTGEERGEWDAIVAAMQSRRPDISVEPMRVLRRPGGRFYQTEDATYVIVHGKWGVVVEYEHHEPWSLESVDERAYSLVDGRPVQLPCPESQWN